MHCDYSPFVISHTKKNINFLLINEKDLYIDHNYFDKSFQSFYNFTYQKEHKFPSN